MVRNGKIKLIRLNDADVRSELKHSEIFQNNTFGGTAPDYGIYKTLRDAIKDFNTQVIESVDFRKLVV